MSSKQTKARETGKRYNLEFSVTSAFFWSLGLFFLLGWIFVLGILVGRGFLPGEVKTLTEMKIQIAKLQDMVSKRNSSDLDKIRKLSKDPKFRFYDELSAKKEDVAKKGLQVQKKNYDQSDLDKRIKALEKLVANRSQPGIQKTEIKTKTDKKVDQSERRGMFTVQLASLGSEIEAVKIVNRLKNKGYPAYFYEASINGKSYYRVRCGTFHTESEAKNFKNILARKEGMTGFISKAGE
ncbi:MAG: SPOR domain-containing protein [Desulfobacterales bacterium]|nr:SPOR domain-containing protein [Desulfobacterales bacterium]